MKGPRAVWRISDMRCIYGYTTALFPKTPRPEEVRATGYHIQLISPSAVVHPCQLLWGLYHALRESERGRARARRVEVEALLWITGSWQISEAFERGGLKEGEREAFVLFFSEGCTCRDIDTASPCRPADPPAEVLSALRRVGGERKDITPGGREAFRRLSGRDAEEEKLLEEVLRWITLKGGRAL